MMDNDVSMKPLLAVAVKEALRLAIKDSTPPGETLADIDLIALGQNLSCRLLGTGGWQIGDMYAGNATPQEVLHACIARPELDPLKDIKDALGLEEENKQLRLKEV